MISLGYDFVSTGSAPRVISVNAPDARPSVGASPHRTPPSPAHAARAPLPPRSTSMKLHLLTLAGLTCAALLGACGDDDPSVTGRPLAITPAAITRLIAEALWDAQRWLDQSATLTDIEGILLPADAAAEPSPDAGAGGPNFIFFPQDADADFEAALDDAVVFLDERVFADAAIESQSGTQVVYRLTSGRFCDAGWEDEDLYQTCVEVLDAVQIRLAVTSYAEGDLDVAVLVGAAKRETLVAELHHTMAALTVRVGPALDALVEIDDATNDGEDGYVPPTLETRLRFAVEVPGAVEIHGQASDDEVPFALSAGAGSVSLDVDRAATTGQLDVDLRDLVIAGPKHLLAGVGASESTVCVIVDGGEEECYVEPSEEEAPPVTGAFEVSVTRLAGLVDLADDQQELAIQGLIAGPLALRLDGTRVVGVELDDGQRPLDILLTPSDDRVDIALSHATTLATVWRMAAAADLWPDMAESFLAHDDMSAAFTGDAPWVSVREAGLVVESGALTLTSGARPDLDRTLEAGLCAWYGDDSSWEESGGSSGESSNPLPADDGTGDTSDQPHPFDIETGATCPAPDSELPISASN